MSTNITEETTEKTSPEAPPPEPPLLLGPSVLRDDSAYLARVIGLIGAALAIFGGMALGFTIFGREIRIAFGWSSLLTGIGLAGLLFHAAFDRDLQFRRTYMAVGFVFLAGGVILTMAPVFAAPLYLMVLGVVGVIVALAFLLAFLKHETDEDIRQLTQLVILGAGAALMVLGMVGIHIFATGRAAPGDETAQVVREWLLPNYFAVAVLGLIYLTAFVSSRSPSDELAHKVGLGVLLVGAVVFVVALVRSALSDTALGAGWIPHRFLVPDGFMQMVLGLLYLLVGLFLVSDNILVVLTRREIGSYFYSPIAYFVLLAFTVTSWWGFVSFLGLLYEASQLGGGGVIEPVMQPYLLNFPLFLSLIVVVPLLTMRLLSEEQRSGTMEVLLTAPVDETTVVLSKFLAAYLMYLLSWLPFLFFPLTLPLFDVKSFDYRPLLSFSLGQLVTGAAFISMGLFFSSLSRNQIISAVLTFTGMGALALASLADLRTADKGSFTGVLLHHISFLNVWEDTLEGKLKPLWLVFPATMTALWLFLTVKVLDARKWT